MVNIVRDVNIFTNALWDVFLRDKCGRYFCRNLQKRNGYKQATKRTCMEGEIFLIL